MSICAKSIRKVRDVLCDGVLGVVRLSAMIKPISDSTRMPVLEFVGCEPLLGGSKKFGVILRIFA